jgi:hypothetical protein
MPVRCRELRARRRPHRLKAGTLDDTSDVQPTVEAWCVDRQPWVTIPGMAVSLERE